MILLKDGVHIREELDGFLDPKLLIFLTILMVSNSFVEHINLSWKDLNIISKIKTYVLFGVLLIIAIGVEIKLLY